MMGDWWEDGSVLGLISAEAWEGGAVLVMVVLLLALGVKEALEEMAWAWRVWCRTRERRRQEREAPRP